jgi:hypothetical protein
LQTAQLLRTKQLFVDRVIGLVMRIGRFNTHCGFWVDVTHYHLCQVLAELASRSALSRRMSDFWERITIMQSKCRIADG